MAQIFVAGTAPDYAGASHTTIVGLLTAIHDTFVNSGWIIIANTIGSTQDFTVRDSSSKVFLRVSFQSDYIYLEGCRDNTFTTLSSQFSCGRAKDGDDTRLYMNCNDSLVAIGCWSNFYNLQEASFAGYPNTLIDNGNYPDSWLIGNCKSDSFMYAEWSVYPYDSSEWMSLNVAHSNEATDIATTGTFTSFAQGTMDRFTVGIPYNNDGDLDNDKNAGWYYLNGQLNGVDDTASIGAFYIIGGRNDTNGDDGDYGAGETSSGVPVNKKSFLTGYFTDIVVGGASYDQRTILTDTLTGYVYVVPGGKGWQPFRIA